MTNRTILSRSGRIAMLMAGAILLTLTGAASARGGGGGFDRTLQRGTTPTQPAKPAPANAAGGTRAPNNGPARVLQ